jgi:hypothetical protein
VRTTPRKITLATLAVAAVAGPLAAAAPAHAVDDRTPPTVGVTVRAADQGTWYRTGSLTVTFTVSDTGSGVADGDGVLRLTGATQGTRVLNEGTTDVVLDTQGETRLAWTVSDREGNVRTGNRTIGLDDVLPTAAVTGVTADQVVLQGSNHPLTTACTDAASGIESCTIESGNALSTATTGAKQVRVSAVDRAGNSAITTIPYSVVSADDTPFTTLQPTTAPTADGWWNAPVTLDARSTTPYAGGQVAKVEWSIGVPGTAGTTLGDHAQLVVATDGTTEVVARGVDELGLVGGFASRVVKLDRVAPTATLAAAGPFTVGEVFSPRGACDDALSGVAGTAFGGLTGTGALDTSTAGTKTVTLTCTDRAGNVTTARRAYEVRGAAVPPTTTPPTTTPATTTTASTTTAKARLVGRTLKVKVTIAANGVAPTGTVTVLDKGKVVGTAQVNARGVAKLKVKLRKGQHRLTAQYTGSKTVAPSTTKIKLR